MTKRLERDSGAAACFLAPSSIEEETSIYGTCVHNLLQSRMVKWGSARDTLIMTRPLDISQFTNTTSDRLLTHWRLSGEKLSNASLALPLNGAAAAAAAAPR